MKEIIMEQDRFLKTKVLVGIVLEDTNNKLKNQMNRHQQSNQEMLNISKDYSSDDVRAELSQSLQIFQQESANNDRLKIKIQTLLSLQKQPYFGRFDVKENSERFYIGLSHFMDPETLDLLVYDWRAPISSLFYEQDYGEKSYLTPTGEEKLTLMLKRHFYSNKEGLTNFYDMDATPADNFLIEVLSETKQNNLSPIVQSIQKKQNEIIRSQEVDLLNVQGVPGSGKSIIALHRMAYLLYHSKGNYHHNNMAILSPNDAFKVYIENVLPALGERMNLQYTMADLLEKTLGTLRQTREEYMNELMTGRKRVIPFKNSKNHYLLLQRWFKYYINSIHPIEDFYFDNKLVIKKSEIKEELIKNCTKKPLEIILNRYQNKLQSLLEYPMKIKFEALESQVEKHNLEPEDANRRLKRLKRHFYKKIHQYNRKTLTLDYYRIFRSMYENKSIVMDLGKDLNIPNEFLSTQFHYDDYFPQLCLKLWINEERSYKQIQYLLVDEAQDYDYIPYMILKNLFFNAKVTLVGDVDQSLVHREMNFFEMTEDVYKPSSHQNISLETCYRSTENIVELAKTYMNTPMSHVGRKGEAPLKITTDRKRFEKDLIDIVSDYKRKYEMGLTIIASSQDMCVKIDRILKNEFSITHNQNDDMKIKDVLVLPIYQAKGFEFDRVLYIRNKINLSQQQHVDYTAVTRAKHHVTVLDLVD